MTTKAQRAFTKETMNSSVFGRQCVLDKAISQWQLGDWESLVKLDYELVKHHEERKSLALLISSAIFQVGDMSAAKRWLSYAQNWGANKVDVARILAAGVYSHLAQANMLLELHSNCNDLTQASLEIGGSNGDIGLLVKARTALQLSKLREQALKSHEAERRDGFIASELIDGQLVLESKLEKLYQESIDRQAKLQLFIKKEADNTMRQVTAFNSLQKYFESGEPVAGYVERLGWPVSYDFGYYLAGLIAKENYDLVVEFGSGVSTVIAAMAAKVESRKNDNRGNTAIVSFEHLEEFYNKTHSLLKSSGLTDYVSLELAPLVSWGESSQDQKLYYDCTERITKLGKSFDRSENKILVVVDGPPGKTNKHARYPAGPIISSGFKQASIDFLLDDTNRKDEKETARLWIKEFEAMGYVVELDEIRLDKGAYLIKVRL